jgi:hypothetical protein
MAETSPKRRRPLVALLKVVLVLVVLAAAWKFGVGPLLSAQRNQPSVVYVANGTAQGYQAVLGWRRLRQTLFPQGYAHYQLYVGMAEKQTLTLTPEGGGTPQQLKVPLRPGCVLLVNVDRAITWFAWEPERSQSLAVPRLDVLRRELAARQAPKALLALRAELAQGAMGCVVEKVDRLFVDLQRYHPYVPTLQEFSELPAAGARRVPLLTTEPLTLQLAQRAELKYDPAKPDDLTVTFPLDAAVTVPLAGNVSASLPAGTPLRLQAAGPALDLTAYALQPGTVTWEGTAFQGSWSYQATCRDGAWSWQWQFSGSGKLKGAEYSLSLSYPHQGKADAKLEKMEVPGMP